MSRVLTAKADLATLPPVANSLSKENQRVAMVPGDARLFGSSVSGVGNTPPSIDTTVKRSGTSSFKFQLITGSGEGCMSFTGLGIGTAQGYVRTWFRFDTLPTGSGVSFLDFFASTPMRVRLRTDGALELVDSAGTVLAGPSTATLSADTWYCIRVGAIQAGTQRVQVNLGTIPGDDATVLDYNPGGAGTLDLAQVRIGKTFNSETTTNGPIFWFDDIAVNNSAGSAENALPSITAKVVAARPESDSSRAGFTDANGGTTNLWQGVDNDPPLGESAGAAPPPVVRAVGAVASGVGGATPGAPAGVLPGDIVVVVGESSEIAGYVAPTDWAHVNVGGVTSPIAVTGGGTLSVLWRRWVIGDSMPAFADVGDHNLLRAFSIRNAIATGNPFEAAASATEAVSDTSAPYPNLTTLSANALVIGLLASSADSTTGPGTAAPATTGAWTNQINNGITTGDGGGIKVDTAAFASAGAITGANATLAVAGLKAMMMLAVKPSDGKTQVESANSNTTDNYEANLASYTTAGIAAGDTVTVVHPIAMGGNGTAATARDLGVQLTSNPAGSAEQVSAMNNTIVAAYPGATGGTAFGHRTVPPAGGTHIEYSPSVTKGNAIKLKIRKGTATTDNYQVIAMGALIEYEPGVSGTTYTKTGQINPKSATLGFSATSKEIASTGTISPKASQSGTDAFEATETGSLQPKVSQSGTDAFTASESGTIAPKALQSGADVANYARQAIFGPKALQSGDAIEEFAETGSLLPKAFQSGTSQKVVGGITYTKTGQIGPKVSMSGADVFEASEAGTIAPKAFTSGADVSQFSETGAISPKATSSAADAFEDTESGTISPKASTSGADAFTTSESGTIAPKASQSGADASVFTESGSIKPKAFLSGTASALASSTYTKTGTIAAKASMSGGDTVEFSESGRISSIVTTSGSKAYETTRTGQVSTVASLNASKATELVKAGTLSAVITLGAQDEATFTRTGSIAVVAFQSGTTTKPAIQVTGMLATKPSLSPTAEPFILTIHEGSSLLWIDEQEMQLLKVRHEVEDLE